MLGLPAAHARRTPQRRLALLAHQRISLLRPQASSHISPLDVGRILLPRHHARHVPQPNDCQARLPWARRCIDVQQLPAQIEGSLALALRQKGHSAARSAWAARQGSALLAQAGYFDTLATMLIHCCNAAELCTLTRRLQTGVADAMRHLRAATEGAFEAQGPAKSTLSCAALRDFAALYQLLCMGRPRTLSLPQHSEWLLHVYDRLGDNAAWVVPTLRSFLQSPVGQHYLRVVRPAVSQWSTRFLREHRLDEVLRQRLANGMEDDVAH